MSNVHFSGRMTSLWPVPQGLRAAGLLSLLVLAATPALSDSLADAPKYPSTRTGDVVDDTPDREPHCIVARRPGFNLHRGLDRAQNKVISATRKPPAARAIRSDD